MYHIWMVAVGSGLWTGIEEHDLTRLGQYDWSYMGMNYHYKVSPDGIVTFDGKSFRVADVQWSYSIMGVSATDKGQIAPAPPIPVEFEGTFDGVAVQIQPGTNSSLRILNFRRTLESFPTVVSHQRNPKPRLRLKPTPRRQQPQRHRGAQTTGSWPGTQASP